MLDPGVLSPGVLDLGCAEPRGYWAGLCGCHGGRKMWRTNKLKSLRNLKYASYGIIIVFFVESVVSRFISISSHLKM